MAEIANRNDFFDHAARTAAAVRDDAEGDDLRQRLVERASYVHSNELVAVFTHC